MSWSISAKGTKAEVVANLNAARKAQLSHVQGKEKEIAEKAVDLALAAIEATDEKFNPSVSMFGSASFDSVGAQNGQSIGVNVNFASAEQAGS
jgi:hypothetical protein